MLKLEIKVLIFITLVLFIAKAQSQKLNVLRTKMHRDSISNNVKGLYLSGWKVGEPEALKHFIDLAHRTEINTYIIDVKEDDGFVSYPSEVTLVKKSKNWIEKYNPIQTLAAFHENNIRVIGRIVCFKDPILPVQRPDLALKDKNGQIWKDQNGIAWLNPYKKDSWKYLVEIAKEALKLGFDEIQFDYVRFTTNGNISTIDFENSGMEKYEAINGFLAYARKQMPSAIISADVFGIICESPKDMEGIGQYLELIGKDVDYISPMVYPSHYALGQIVNDVMIPKPDLDPYAVVFNAITKAKNRISTVKDYRAKLRPYLQDFTDTNLGLGNFQKYGAQQIRQQINAVYNAGYQGWIFWNINGKYSEDGFLLKSDGLNK
jgi:hypothetical protein